MRTSTTWECIDVDMLRRRLPRSQAMVKRKLGKANRAKSKNITEFYSLIIFCCFRSLARPVPPSAAGVAVPM